MQHGCEAHLKQGLLRGRSYVRRVWESSVSQLPAAHVTCTWPASGLRVKSRSGPEQPGAAGAVWQGRQLQRGGRVHSELEQQCIWRAEGQARLLVVLQPSLQGRLAAGLVLQRCGELLQLPLQQLLLPVRCADLLCRLRRRLFSCCSSLRAKSGLRAWTWGARHPQAHRIECFPAAVRRTNVCTAANAASGQLRQRPAQRDGVAAETT